MNLSSSSPDNSPFQQVIARQRASLFNMLFDPMKRTALRCAEYFDDKERLDQRLLTSLNQLPFGTFMYVMTADGVQISDNATHTGLMNADFGRDRSDRPYMLDLQADQEMTLSEAYISLRSNRPSVTAIQRIYRDEEFLGYLGADFDLRDLPLTREHYRQPGQWRQIKGDPSIRRQVFQQTRIESRLDKQIDLIIPVLEELMTENGIFNSKILFSSSRASLWSLDDPMRYHLLSYEELVDPDICLVYSHCDYPDDALIAKDQIRPILDTFKHLRFADDTIYLRGGSINIFNGLVGLNFSCDGSHYIPHDQFLANDSEFWEGI